MKLPAADQAVVEREKIVNYLLNPNHPHGAGKATYFAAFGFEPGAWKVLAAALREHGRSHPVVRTTETGFGPRFVVEGELTTPDGRHPQVRTVWQADDGQIAPRLITAYPVEAL